MRAGLDRIHALLLEPECSQALWVGANSGDSDVRRLCYALLAEGLARLPWIRRVLEAALREPDPRVRRWATRTATSRRWTPREVRDALLPLLEADRSPEARIAALRVRARQPGGEEAVLHAALDRSAGVRFYARRFLARMGAATDTRALALEVLVKPDAGRRAVVGALATLSEVGREEDVSVVSAFLADPRRTVVREADRTLSFLEPCEH